MALNGLVELLFYPGKLKYTSKQGQGSGTGTVLRCFLACLCLASRVVYDDKRLSSPNCATYYTTRVQTAGIPKHVFS